jgi:hypothetical protein
LAEIARLAWKRFSIIVAIVGDAQGQFLATLFYFTILAPFGLLARLFIDPLGKPQTTWIARDPVENGLEGAKRQG